MRLTAEGREGGFRHPGITWRLQFEQRPKPVDLRFYGRGCTGLYRTCCKRDGNQVQLPTQLPTGGLGVAQIWKSLKIASLPVAPLGIHEGGFPLVSPQRNSSECDYMHYAFIVVSLLARASFLALC